MGGWNLNVPHAVSSVYHILYPGEVMGVRNVSSSTPFLLINPYKMRA